MGVVLLTGLSGSGKTTALRALEDVGFLCMDNLPVVLLPKVIELAEESGNKNLAIVVDARDRRFIGDAGEVVDALVDKGVDLRIAYIESAPHRIIQRFSETRRRHPLADTGDFRAAIDEERSLLDELRDRASITIDTTELTVHELKKLVQDQFAPDDRRRMAIKVASFGFKHGPLLSADLVFDVRFIANPYFVERLRGSTGLDSEVASFVMEQDGVSAFVEQVSRLLAFLIPRYEAEGKAYLTIGIGCTGGKHRSVALAEHIGANLRQCGVDLVVEHRDRALWNVKGHP